MGQYNNNDVQGHADDPVFNNGNVPDPDTGALAETFDDAYIKVVDADVGGDQGNLNFQHHFQDAASTFTYLQPHKLDENDAYWSSHVAGIYEGWYQSGEGSDGKQGDDDPNDEHGVPGG